MTFSQLEVNAGAIAYGNPSRVAESELAVTSGNCQITSRLLHLISASSTQHPNFSKVLRLIDGHEKFQCLPIKQVWRIKISCAPCLAQDFEFTEAP